MVAGTQQGGLPALLVKELSDQLEALLKVSHSTPIATQSVWISAFQVACPRFCHLTLCGNETASMFQVELECQRGRAKCGRSLSGKDDFAEHKYLVGIYQLTYQNLKTALRLTDSSSLWLLKAQRSCSAFVFCDRGEHDLFLSPSSL